METRRSGFTGSSRVSPFRPAIVVASGSHAKHNYIMTKNDSWQAKIGCPTHQEVIFLFARGANITVQRHDSISPSAALRRVKTSLRGIICHLPAPTVSVSSIKEAAGALKDEMKTVVCFSHATFCSDSSYASWGRVYRGPH